MISGMSESNVYFFRNKTTKEEKHTMEYYTGLDVSQRQTAICVVDGGGKIVAEGKALTQPASIHGWLVTKNIPLDQIVKVSLEAGAMSNWLHTLVSGLRCRQQFLRGLPDGTLDDYFGGNAAT